MSSDLHTHTTCSDGKLTPEELISAAREAGLDYIAITDHDTTDGIRELYESGLFPSKQIKIIPGIEFSAHHETQNIHIIGYNINIYNSELQEKLNSAVNRRWSRFSAIIGKLQDMGYDISEGDVLRIAGASTSISRSHIARAMVEKGLFTSVGEVFSKLLEKGRPAYEPHYRMEPEEIINIIKNADGIPVLAHPKLIHDDELVESIIKLGIEGLEAIYPQHDEYDTRRYTELADRYNLLITGGSDFHGIKGRIPEQLGEFTVDNSFAEAIYREIEF